MIYRLWLIFAQTATVLLAIFFVVSTLRPDLLSWHPPGDVVTVTQVAPQVTADRPDSYAKAAEIAMPAVVNVFTSKEVKTLIPPLLGDPFESKPKQASNLGSGVIVSPSGYILTSRHVIEASDEVEVALIDGRKAKAKIIGSDPETDLAVMKINLKDLPSMVFGQSEQVKVGDVVLALGNPFGVGQSVTMGIISALGRRGIGINTYENFIQTDAAINIGNSGGALVDTSGNLIGINTAIFSGSGEWLGIGFTIPIHAASQIMEKIIQSGRVTRGWLGVSMQDLTEEFAESVGFESVSRALVAGVLKDGPADKAGIKPGDILIAIEGKPLKNSHETLNFVATLSPGDTVTVTVVRDKQEKSFPVKVGVRPRQP